jgi:protein phosphatase 2C
MSRALGDFSLKPQGAAQAPLLLPEPEMTITPYGAAGTTDEFMLVASDGVWDVFSDEEACALVRQAIVQAKLLAATADGGASAELLERCPALALCQAAYLKGSTDNITAVVVELDGGGVDVGSGGSVASTSKL